MSSPGWIQTYTGQISATLNPSCLRSKEIRQVGTKEHRKNNSADSGRKSLVLSEW
ncbi:unnamed protein product [Brassica oleracea]